MDHPLRVPHSTLLRNHVTRGCSPKIHSRCTPRQVTKRVSGIIAVVLWIVIRNPPVDRCFMVLYPIIDRFFDRFWTSQGQDVCHRMSSARQCLFCLPADCGRMGDGVSPRRGLIEWDASKLTQEIVRYTVVPETSHPFFMGCSLPNPPALGVPPWRTKRHWLHPSSPALDVDVPCCAVTNSKGMRFRPFWARTQGPIPPRKDPP